MLCACVQHSMASRRDANLDVYCLPPRRRTRLQEWGWSREPPVSQKTAGGGTGAKAARKKVPGSAGARREEAGGSQANRRPSQAGSPPALQRRVSPHLPTHLLTAAPRADQLLAGVGPMSSWPPSPAPTQQASEQEKALREFACGICKNVLAEPVSTPCGAVAGPSACRMLFKRTAPVAIAPHLSLFMPLCFRVLRVRRLECALCWAACTALHAERPADVNHTFRTLGRYPTLTGVPLAVAVQATTSASHAWTRSLGALPTRSTLAPQQAARCACAKCRSPAPPARSVAPVCLNRACTVLLERL